MTVLDFIIFGFIAGITPGPITALILGETLNKGFKEGIKIPMAIIFSNLVFAPLTFIVLNFGFNSDFTLQVLSYIGAGFLIFLGMNDLFKNQKKLELKVAHDPFKKAFFMDLFNPHPYITWFTILGPPVIVATNTIGFFRAVILAIGFIASLVGTKIIVVIFASSLKRFLTQKHIRFVNVFLAFLLIFFGLKIFSNFY